MEVLCYYVVMLFVLRVVSAVQEVKYSIGFEMVIDNQKVASRSFENIDLESCGTNGEMLDVNDLANALEKRLEKHFQVSEESTTSLNDVTATTPDVTIPSSTSILTSQTTPTIATSTSDISPTTTARTSESYDVTTTTDVTTPMPKGRGTWKRNGRYEYFVSSGGVSKSFVDSQTYCNEQGGELALVKTKKVQEFIQTLVTDGSDVPYGFYIGLRDIEANGTFVWSDGEALNYSIWQAGEPNNIGTETCVRMGDGYTYSANLPWINVHCVVGTTGPKGFVCQRKIEQDFCEKFCDDIKGAQNQPVGFAGSGGIAELHLSPTKTIKIYCDCRQNENWIVIQRRINDSVSFNQTWENYTEGFGDPLGNYWMGLETIHNLTGGGKYKLRIDLEDWEGNKTYALYQTFTVGNEESNYTLIDLGKYSGSIADSFFTSKGMQFSTFARDNDKSTEKVCANLFPSGWWWSYCGYSNLNGIYGNNTRNKGIRWYYPRRDWRYSYRNAEMKISLKDDE